MADMNSYQDVLREYGFSEELPVDVVLEELEEKLNRELERLDMMIGKGEEDRAEVKQREVEKIEAAKEIAEQRLRELSQAIVLDTETDEERLSRLQNTVSKEAAYREAEVVSQASPQGAASGAQQPDKDEKRIKNMMNRAGQDLDDQNWDEAKKHYDAVLDLDPENGEAYLGFWMAKFKLSPSDIPKGCWEIQKKQKTDPFEDSMCNRAYRWGSDELKKQIDDYKKGRDYLTAQEAQQRAETDDEYRNVAALFGMLGDFADSKQKQEECEHFWRSRKYNQAVGKIKEAETKQDLRHGRINYTQIIKDYKEAECLLKEIGDFENAKEKIVLARYQQGKNRLMQDTTVTELDELIKLFQELGDYQDAQTLLLNCQQRKEEKLQREAVKRNYTKELSEFKRQFMHLEGVSVHSENVNKLLEKRNKILIKSDGVSFIWLIIIAGGGGLCFFYSNIGDFLSSHSSFFNDSIISLFGIGGLLIAGCFLSSGIIESGWISLFLGYIIAGIVCAVVHGIGYGARNLYINHSGLIHIIGLIILILSLVLFAVKIILLSTNASKRNQRQKLDRMLENEVSQVEDIIAVNYKSLFERYVEIGNYRESIVSVRKELINRFIQQKELAMIVSR